MNVPVAGPSGDANVVGAPHLDLTYHGTAAPQKTWVYAQFVNPRNGTVLGNIATPIPLTLDGQTHSISRDLEMVAGARRPGGGYTLQLTASSSLYDLQRSAGSRHLRRHQGDDAARRPGDGAAERRRSTRRRRSGTSASTAARPARCPFGGRRALREWLRWTARSSGGRRPSQVLLVAVLSLSSRSRCRTPSSMTGDG